MPNATISITEGVCQLATGGLITYPTESVYGFGCDPWREDSVEQLLALKHRSIIKGFILIAANWSQITPLIQPIPEKKLSIVKDSWPGPITWVFPATDEVPLWVRGAHATVAIRLTDHPVCLALAEQFGQPIVSSSANLDGYAPIKDIPSLKEVFCDKTPPIVDGHLGNRHQPTPIHDALTHEVLRPSDLR